MIAASLLRCRRLHQRSSPSALIPLGLLATAVLVLGDGPASVPRFALPSSNAAPELQRATHPGAFVGVMGRRGAWLGYEQRPFEAWVYPLKVVDGLALSFSLDGYPLEIPANEIAASISTRPERTVITYAHAAFTVRQILFAPLDAPALVMLLDVSTTLPLTVTGAFRPRLRPMWPGTAMTPNVSWSPDDEAYLLTDESRRFAGLVGVPHGRDVSVMPYQEEPRDVPLRFVVEVGDRARSEFVPIVLTGSVNGRDEALATYRAVLAGVRDEYARVVAYWNAFARRTVAIDTPDDRLDEAFAWATVGTDKGIATNPALGTGFLAGFRTSGDSERPGFAWFFGRDTVWSAFAATSYGDLDAVKTGLALLRKFQRLDGKIPHEISQSAALIPWFDEYPYPWASADATPLYVIAQADLWRFGGDRAFLTESWSSILGAYRFTRGTDADANGLVDNTGVGHGWVEGGALYPPHEEIYQQGVWIEAQRSLAELADVMGDAALAREAREGADRTLASTERRYWLEDRGFYAYATRRPTDVPVEAEPGPARERRQARLDELRRATMFDEDTVLPAVPMWWGLLDDARAQRQLDRLGSGSFATDWGARILSAESRLYDPLSYHYGSVWPLFTGWAAMAAYRYGRPHVGLQAIEATAALTWDGGLGSITELLSGDYNTAFGRSSHHQTWSEAMLVTPVLRGLLGIDLREAGSWLRVAPQLPPSWDRVTVTHVHYGGRRWTLEMTRAAGMRRLHLRPEPGSGEGDGRPLRVTFAPGLPLDARARRATVNGRAVPFQDETLGDITRPTVTTGLPATGVHVEVTVDEGTDVWVERRPVPVGAGNEGLRILRARASRDRLSLALDGRAGRSYIVRVRTPATVQPAEGVEVTRTGSDRFDIAVQFETAGSARARRDLDLPLRR